MADSNITLRFDSSTDGNVDMRTFRVLQVVAGTAMEMELYKFSHPLTSHSMGTTTFHRKNLDTLVYETAGHIDWFSSINATVWFGVDEVTVKDLRRVKKGGQSRRFKASGVEYKWRLQDNGTDMFCIDSKDQQVAIWSGEGRRLKVVPRFDVILDRIVVTCFLNLWFKKLGRW